MPRKSSRLAAKKRVNYNEDSLWYRALGKGKDAWNEMIEVAADDPPPVIKPWQKKKPKKLFQKKKLFRKKPPKVKKVLKRTKALIEKDEAEIDYPDTPEQRVDRILKVPDKKVKAVSRLTQDLSRKRKHLLFMNPGDVPIQTAILALARGERLPAWAVPFRNQLGLTNGRLTWTEVGGTLPMALQAEKRTAVKKLYFDPREPATIRPIAEKLYKVWANINRRNVRNILQSLETYQLNRGRRRPPDIKNRMFLKSPGMLAMDMFFPSVNLGWEKTNVLCCMDTWSRY